MNGWTKWLVLGSLILFVIPNRYRILNLLFKSIFIRRFAVKGAMSIPGLRAKFMQSTFR